MEHATERVSDWAGVRLVQEALGEVGWERFPVLRAELPNGNGGSTGPAAAALVSQELARFTGQGVLAPGIRLLDAATGDEVMRHIATYEGLLLLGPGYRAGLDPEGFFVRRDRGTGAGPDAGWVTFRAHEFEQSVVEGGGGSAAPTGSWWWWCRP